jgi:hypothetical protein
MTVGSGRYFIDLSGQSNSLPSATYSDYSNTTIELEAFQLAGYDESVSLSSHVDDEIWRWRVHQMCR